LLVAAVLGAAQVNIAPDAVTHATEGYNTYEGDLASLTDGLHPGNSDHPAAFVWPARGNLVFQFAVVRPVSGMRLCVGRDAGSYVPVAYRGARFGANGQTDGRGAEVVAEAANAELQENTWVALSFPAGTLADYLELSTDSGAEFYEVEVLTDVAGSTQIEAESWGVVKEVRP
jgi:hypothetical protein